MKSPYYRCLTILSMIFFGTLWMEIIFYKKLIFLGSIGFLPLVLFISPFLFMFSDVLAEVYGFRESLKVFYSSLLILGGFLLLCVALSHLPAHLKVTDGYFSSFALSDTNLMTSYRLLFDHAFLMYFSIGFPFLIANYVNIKIFSIWKIALKGRFFWFRSVTASFFAIFIASILGVALSPYILSGQLFLKVMLCAFISKILYLIIFSTPMTYLNAWLKKLEKLEVSDQAIYNPFQRQDPL